jgi:type IV secretion system protein VirB10
MVTSDGEPDHRTDTAVLPTRFRRGFVVLAVTLLLGVLAGALAVPFFVGPQKREATVKNDDNASTSMPSIASNAPANYADAAKMAAERAGRDLRAATLPKLPEKPDPAPAAAPASTSPVASLLGANERTEQEAARNASVFFKQDGSQQLRDLLKGAATAPQVPTVTQAAKEKPLYGDMQMPTDAQGGLTMQKNAFMANSATTKDYVTQPVQHPRSKYELKAGSVIAGALITPINSDLPGEVTAQVTENVYDTVSGRYLLIPQGSRLIGKYDSLISYGQRRALVAWNRVIMPNGNSVQLEAMPGSDETGAAGLEDEVDHHRLAFIGALIASTVLDVGPSLASSMASSGSSGSTTNIYTQPAQFAAQQGEQIGQQLMQKELGRPNTITVRAGWPLRVLVNKDIVFEAYHAD